MIILSENINNIIAINFVSTYDKFLILKLGNDGIGYN